jgi:hypothetical protein
VPGGGSSRVFRKAFAASSLKSSASSTKPILRTPRAGFIASRLQNSRIELTGSSCFPSGVVSTSRSGCEPAAAWAQAGHLAHAVKGAGGFSHNKALASSRAKVRLPTPSGPTNR